MLILHPVHLLVAAGVEMECIINVVQERERERERSNVLRSRSGTDVWACLRVTQSTCCLCKQMATLLIFTTDL
jgi:hypothetical protein